PPDSSAAPTGIPRCSATIRPSRAAASASSAPRQPRMSGARAAPASEPGAPGTEAARREVPMPQNSRREVLATRDVRPERSIGELFSQLTQDVGTLVRQEAALARTEIRDKVSHVTGNAGGLAIGGFIAFVGALALT